MQSQSCAAVVIAAPASGQGKTTVTAVLARHYRQQNKQVRVFKVGPDFLDPMVLEYASGHPVYQLDLWMVGKQHSQQLLAEAAQQADIILIEGVMGLFDGEPSTADLATAFGIPILAVIDASAMAQTFAAIAVGLDQYRKDTRVAAVIANKVGSERHADMLKKALPNTLPCLATLFRQTEHALPSRYLGLQQANEVTDLEQRLSHTLDAFDFDNTVSLPDIDFPLIDVEPLPLLLEGVKIGVARDAAFSFLYQANLDCLSALGAELIFFSPLTDKQLPDIDSLYLPGGYPELHLETLSQNTNMIQAIHQHYHANKPIIAECGGMLYLCESLTDKADNTASLCGILPAKAKLQARLTALGLQEVTINGAAIRGHTYHHSLLSTELVSEISGRCPNGKSVSEAVYQQQRLTASYIHFYFYSNPHLIAAWLMP
ncbi:cobyrinate a,c-diamide synthase [Methylophaga thalassica]|uniref:cobyrinate a,c-diamide synthase n=1 Tax=Methylophaga aminisulfidivorans TaxID=230105 RepID=UPI003A92A3F1